MLHLIHILFQYRINMHIFKRNLGTTTYVGILIQKASCNFRIKVKVKMTVILMFWEVFLNGISMLYEASTFIHWKVIVEVNFGQQTDISKPNIISDTEIYLLNFQIFIPLSCPPRWRRGSGLDFGLEDPDSIPRLPSPRVGPLMARR